jgi:predicted PurR-regulated permease PerM
MTPAHPSNFFFGILIAVIVLSFVMFLPFLTPIVLAAAIAVVFGPVHRFFVRKIFGNKERSSFASLITLVIITAIIFIPALLIAGKVYVEVQDMYGFLTDEAGRSQVITLLNKTTQALSHAFLDIYPAYSFDTLNVTEILQKVLAWVFSNIDSLFNGASKAVISIFVMFLALFYFMRDGRELKRQIISLSPLGDSDDELIFKKLEQAIYSIFAGSIIVGLIQGILTGIGFAIFDVPSPALWGSIASITALIPGIGTALVLVPGILYLAFTGLTTKAVGLLIWSVLAVGLIDNFLGPVFVNRGVKIHPFMILISVLGGMIFFGPIGFLLGPIVLALLFSLLEIYRSSYGKKI